MTLNMILIEVGCFSAGGADVLTPWSMDVFLGLLAAGVYDVEVARDDGAAVTLSTLAVQESAPAFDIVPNVGASTAPERVRLLGLNIGCPSSACGEPIVRFGEDTVAIEAAGADFIEVQPIRGSGTVDVTVTRGGNVVRRKAAFHFFEAGRRPSPEFFTPVLFPVLFSAKGAFGSEWDSEAAMRNDNNFPVIAPYPLPFPQFPFRQFTLTVSAKAAGLSSPGGHLIYVPRRGEDGLHFGLLVRDLSRQAEALGVEVPVVREEELFDGSFSLLNVPADPRFRVSLRIFSIDKPATVRMVVRPMNADNILLSRTLDLATQSGEGQHHASATISDISGHGPLRIEISPADKTDVRLWAFASVTNNETQHVTVLTPQ
jgi:hypothetical protein